MKIVHIVPLISPRADYGGPARGTMRQAAYTSGLGEAVEVVSLWPRGAGPSPDEMLGVRLRLFPVSFRIPGHKFVGLWSFGAARWALTCSRAADVVHFHGGREIWVVLCALVLRALGVPYVWQSHGMLAPTTSRVARLLDGTLMPVVLRGARTVLYLTPRERQELSDLYALTNLQLLINGIDNVVADESISVPRPEEPLRVVVTSRLQRRKRIPELVEAVSACRARGTNVELTIFGPDEGDRASVETAIAASDHGEAIRYAGSLAYADVRPELARHQVIALTSVDEPFPNSVLEGMAQGLAPLISRSCGLTPYVESHQAGVIVEDEDRDGLERALTALAEDPARLVALRRNSAELARLVFSMEEVALRLRELYAESVHRPAKERVFSG
jgi:glycosyltransferase involved in cell wall biosynthesis